MTTSRFFFLSICFILAAFYLQAQSNKSQIITGQIFDSKTKKPIPHVEIFISGTTSGCISDSLGNFVLKVPFFPCAIVADHVAYESFVKPLKKSEESLKIELIPSLFFVDEVSVSGKNRRKKNLRFFYSNFISDNRNKIKIINDSVLIFENSKTLFKAKSKEPLVIINKLLGYKIKLLLTEFSISKTDQSNENFSLKGSETIAISGYYFFEPLKASTLKKQANYDSNRRKYYFGSYRHFLSSIYNDETKIQGFELDVYPKGLGLSGLKPKNNITETQGVKEFFQEGDSIIVNYKYGKDRYPYLLSPKESNISTEKSMIYLTNEILTIRQNGTIPFANIEIVGPMSRCNNLANSLPENYTPTTR